MVDKIKIGRVTRKGENPEATQQMKLKQGISTTTDSNEGLEKCNPEKNWFLAASPIRINWKLASVSGLRHERIEHQLMDKGYKTTRRRSEKK